MPRVLQGGAEGLTQGIHLAGHLQMVASVYGLLQGIFARQPLCILGCPPLCAYRLSWEGIGQAPEKYAQISAAVLVWGTSKASHRA